MVPPNEYETENLVAAAALFEMVGVGLGKSEMDELMKNFEDRKAGRRKPPDVNEIEKLYTEYFKARPRTPRGARRRRRPPQKNGNIPGFDPNNNPFAAAKDKMPKDSTMHAAAARTQSFAFAGV